MRLGTCSISSEQRHGKNDVLDFAWSVGCSSWEVRYGSDQACSMWLAVASSTAALPTSTTSSSPFGTILQDAGARELHLLGTCFSDSFQPAALDPGQLLMAAASSVQDSMEQMTATVQPLLRLDSDEIDFGACAASAGPQYIVVPVHNDSGVPQAVAASLHIRLLEVAPLRVAMILLYSPGSTCVIALATFAPSCAEISVPLTTRCQATQVDTPDALCGV